MSKQEVIGILDKYLVNNDKIISNIITGYIDECCDYCRNVKWLIYLNDKKLCNGCIEEHGKCDSCSDYEHFSDMIMCDYCYDTYCINDECAENNIIDGRDLCYRCLNKMESLYSELRKHKRDHPKSKKWVYRYGFGKCRGGGICDGKCNKKCKSN